jgi:hypothetical protein
MRGMPVGGNDPYLRPDVNYAENPNGNYIELTSTGFNIQNLGSTEQFIYMAIRRPNKPPELATEVFAIDTGNSNSTIPCFDSGFPVDFVFRRDNYTSGGTNPRAQSRLQGSREMYTSLSAAEANDSNAVWDSNEGWCKSEGIASISWMFKRAPGFMDVVAYEGNGTASNTIYHNLEAVPELMIIKNRDNSTYGEWGTYYKTATAGGPTKYLVLNTNAAQISTGTPGHWRETQPTATTFALGSDWDVNGSYSYIAHLFATLPGISKVGSYTGNGGTQNIDCGFTNGARFVLIKRTDAAADWYVFDTLRGIGSGNDPSLKLNSTDAQNANENIINPLAAGFTLNTAYTAFNGSGGTYLFLAIA